MRIPKPTPRTLTPTVGVGVLLVIAVCYSNGWLTRSGPPDGSKGPDSAADFQLAETRKSIVFIKCLTPGLPPMFGSGFLVSPDGLIYTNRHVIQPDQPIQGSIVLVGVPSAANPEVLEYYRAEVGYAPRTREPLDFAVLKIAARPDRVPFKALPLARELLKLGSDVAVLGYPTINNELRVLSFTRGNISAARVVLDGRPYYQTDAAVNPGNSGGPLVNARGEAVGIVTMRKANASNMSYALYLSELRLAAALAKKQFAASRPEPGPLDPRRLPTLPAIPPETSAWQVVRGEARAERGLLSVHNDGGAYWLAGKEDLPENCQVVVNCRVEFLKGRQLVYPAHQSIFRTLIIRLSSDGPDQDIMNPGGTRVQLSQDAVLLWQGNQLVQKTEARGTPDDAFVLTVTRQRGTIAVAIDEETVLRYRDDKASAAPAPGRLSIGGCLSRLQLGEVSVVKLPGETGPAEIVRTVSPTPRAGKPRKVGPPVIVPPESPPPLVTVRPPELAQDLVVKQIPSKIADVAVGGGGRYLVLHLPQVPELAIFDVSEARVVGAVPLVEANVKFAAGLDKLVVVLPAAKAVERWDLATRQREEVAPLPLKEAPALAVMGSASRGPVLLGGGAGINSELVFLDVHTLKPLDVVRTGEGLIHLDKNVHIRASADGTVFGIGGTIHPPRGVQTLVLAGSEARGHYSADSAGHVVPGPDGRVIYTFRGRFTQDAEPIDRVGREAPCCLPAQQGIYSLSFTLANPFNFNGGRGQRASVHTVSGKQPLAQLTPELLAGIDLWDRSVFPADRRIHFIPSAKVLVTIPGGNDRLVLHRFDPEEVLEKSGVEYLFVTSLPPAWARKGATYRYQVGVKSRRGGLQYRLVAGPNGLEVSKTGLVTWPVPAGYAEPECEVVVAVRDQTPQEIQHRFKIALRE